MFRILHFVMIIHMQCSYNPATNEISYWYAWSLPPSPGEIIAKQPVKNTISLSNDTHNDTRQLTNSDNTMFLQISAQLRISDQLLAGLMKSKYYTTVFLPYVISIAEFGSLGDFIPMYYVFSAICVPYTFADYIAFLNPKYKSQLAGNTSVKDLIRALLVVPGLPLTLLFYIFISFAPNAGA
jgi:hypothetical protein